MIEAIHRIGLLSLARACLVVAGAYLAQEASAQTSKHLFILSGQSNMTKSLVHGFSAKVGEAYGNENATIAMSMKSGRGIRFWCADYRYSDHHKPSEQEQRDNGSLYPALLESVKAAAGDQKFESVTLIWMQGESDAKRGYADVYAESFLKLLQRLETDLQRDDIKFVIGRLSDFDLKNEKYPHWTRMRDVQVKLAEDHKDGKWIDTDDFINEQPNAAGDLHYRPEESTKLGERFAAKAIEMIGQ